MQKKIVIVDDDYGIQDVAKLLFERAGYHTVVLSGPSLLYDCEHTDACIILLDRQLGGLDGADVCKDLKQKTEFANTPILLMSATNGVPENIENSMADGFIEKPFQKKDLLKRIDDLLLTAKSE